jgi:hypothetical protein
MNPFGRWLRIESAGYDDKGRHEVGFGVGERGVVFFGLGYVFVRDEGLRRRIKGGSSAFCLSPS